MEQANRERFAKDFRALILRYQSEDQQEEILKQLIESQSPDFNFLRQGLILEKGGALLNDSSKRFIDPRTKKMLMKGTNLPQLLILMANIPSSYYGHPLFNRALSVDMDDSLAFSRSNFRKYFRELQNYVSFEAVEQEFARTLDEMSMQEHKYNMVNEDHNMHATKHFGLRIFLSQNASPSFLSEAWREKTNHEKFVRQQKKMAEAETGVMNWVFEKIRAGASLFAPTASGGDPRRFMENNTPIKKKDSVDLKCYRILQKLYVLLKLFNGYNSFEHLRSESPEPTAASTAIGAPLDYSPKTNEEVDAVYRHFYKKWEDLGGMKFDIEDIEKRNRFFSELENIIEQKASLTNELTEHSKMDILILPMERIAPAPETDLNTENERNEDALGTGIAENLDTEMFEHVLIKPNATLEKGLNLSDRDFQMLHVFDDVAKEILDDANKWKNTWKNLETLTRDVLRGVLFINIEYRLGAIDGDTSKKIKKNSRDFITSVLQRYNELFDEAKVFQSVQSDNDETIIKKCTQPVPSTSPPAPIFVANTSVTLAPTIVVYPNVETWERGDAVVTVVETPKSGETPNKRQFTATDARELNDITSLIPNTGSLITANPELIETTPSLKITQQSKSQITPNTAVKTNWDNLEEKVKTAEINIRGTTLPNWGEYDFLQIDGSDIPLVTVKLSRHFSNANQNIYINEKEMVLDPQKTIQAIQLGDSVFDRLLSGKTKNPNFHDSITQPGSCAIRGGGGRYVNIIKSVYRDETTLMITISGKKTSTEKIVISNPLKAASIEPGDIALMLINDANRPEYEFKDGMFKVADGVIKNGDNVVNVPPEVLDAIEISPNSFKLGSKIEKRLESGFRLNHYTQEGQSIKVGAPMIIITEKKPWTEISIGENSGFTNAYALDLNFEDALNSGIEKKLEKFGSANEASQKKVVQIAHVCMNFWARGVADFCFEERIGLEAYEKETANNKNERIKNHKIEIAKQVEMNFDGMCDFFTREVELGNPKDDVVTINFKQFTDRGTIVSRVSFEPPVRTSTNTPGKLVPGNAVDVCSGYYETNKKELAEIINSKVKDVIYDVVMNPSEEAKTQIKKNGLDVVLSPMFQVVMETLEVMDDERKLQDLSLLDRTFAQHNLVRSDMLLEAAKKPETKLGLKKTAVTTGTANKYHDKTIYQLVGILLPDYSTFLFGALEFAMNILDITKGRLPPTDLLTSLFHTLSSDWDTDKTLAFNELMGRLNAEETLKIEQ